MRCHFRLAHSSSPSHSLQLDAAQQEQIHPKHAHEMPVDCRVFEKAPPRQAVAVCQTTEKIHEREDSRAHVQHMDKCEDVEKRTVWIRCQVDSLRAEISARRGIAPRKRRHPAPASPAATLRRPRCCRLCHPFGIPDDAAKAQTCRCSPAAPACSSRESAAKRDGPSRANLAERRARC